MTKNLNYFMRESAKIEEIVSIPGIESIKDEKGEIVPFRVRVLSPKTRQDILGKYRTKKVALDNKRKPIVEGGQLVYEIDEDGTKAMRHMVVEALEYPNLKDPELMQFFNCYDFTEMPLLVFSKPGELAKVNELVLSALNGLDGEGDINKEIADAKN